MRILGYLASIAVLSTVLAAQAQTPTPTADRIAYDAAFQASLKNPSDPATVLRYAEAAVKVNDYEGAISGLERLLLISGDQPRVKLELGTLYYRLGSYEAARADFESALRFVQDVRGDQANAPVSILPPSTTGPANRSFPATCWPAFNTRSNANSGPTGGICAFGTTVLPNPTFSQRGDFAGVFAANIHHRYDLERQDSGALESNVSFYGTRQFQVSEANVALLDINTGPRMKPFGGWAEQISVRPFIMGRYVAVDDMTSYWAWGAGAEANVPLAPKISANIVLLGQRREFVNSNLAPFNNESTGVEAATVFDLRAEITPNFWVTVGGNVSRFTAVVQSQSYWQFGAGTSATLRFADPIGINGRPWQMTANAYTSHGYYDQPDVFIDPTITRTQVDYGVGLALSIPLDERFALTAQTSYAQRSAVDQQLQLQRVHQPGGRWPGVSSKRPWRTSMIGLTRVFSLLSLGCCLALPALAQQVGVTSVAVGEPHGTPPAQSERILRVGIDVECASERIVTRANDRAHLVFLDGSALTIGPDSNLVIDRFVYDPSTQTGDLAMSATRGVFRFVGGAISSKGAVVVTTPTASIGISRRHHDHCHRQRRIGHRHVSLRQVADGDRRRRHQRGNPCRLADPGAI